MNGERPVKTFQCTDCEQIKEVSLDVDWFGKSKGTGYARRPEPNEYGAAGKVCYDCCAKWDLAYMKREGKIALYVTERRSLQLDTQQAKRCRPIRISNWPGSLSFVIHRYRYSDHNFAGRQGRLDIWFHYDGHVWHGVNIGDSMILRCRQTQRKA